MELLPNPGYPHPQANPPPMTAVPQYQQHAPPQNQTTCFEGRIYSLEVAQQPIRARMCGFGDKDRRPITPPPCVRLVIRDAATNKEIDINEIDTTFFVLTVDLWNAAGSREVNLVRHSATSPSISTATSSSYPPPPPHAITYPAYHGAAAYPQQGGYPPYYPQPGYNPQAQYAYGHTAAAPYYPQMQSSYYHPPGTPTQAIAPQPHPHALQSPTGGMFTRNLIGSLSASAFRLTDPDNKIGIWFILQDLSVRTEGSFRLKMNFVDVGKPSSPDQPGTSPMLNTGSAPVLATVFSEPFQVYSAKKFPGVIESTALSKCFAIQGIKIPIRKDGVKATRSSAAGGPVVGRVHEEEVEGWDE
ncbi:hypothetical protein AJ80_09735 [Polytolypa hystricis UAMH7299]|uniref:Velvet domain-containing protein n=1 Tax=Polytolypa hystricis (strain UAMH7299) TaxID=1447883 RepID=A0A2B7WK35_POLH7|nr:hypothetical protein AJ80_09735 [Polytolypa hystricis UAMH7299]